jgi:hypothetical protein
VYAWQQRLSAVSVSIREDIIDRAGDKDTLGPALEVLGIGGPDPPSGVTQPRGDDISVPGARYASSVPSAPAAR